WRQISLPNGIPNQQAARFSVTPQTSVPNLIYGCWQPVTDPQMRGTAQMWRSEDQGRTWKALPTPAGLSPQQAGCYIETSPGAPDTVFLTVPLGDKADFATYYSLDRGEHWQTLPRPAGSELWDVAAPKVEGDVWYYIRTVGVTQPEIWVSRDHG